MDTTKTVNVWEETVTIPTYQAGQPEKYPLFIEKRAYQGSSGKIYPLPVTEKISDDKTDAEYRAVFLENEYLKVMILPELGGRIQRAYDKTNGYDFVYYNHVIRPALVGLAGPWISGGIEFNWPQHHRPTTFAPVDVTLEQKEDGSATVYVGETDRMCGTKGLAAISLYPGKAYIEIRGQLYNGTDFPQTFLWWANPAVPVNDHTYSVFPPDVTAVMDHGKRAVSTFPIATGEYYKWDYSAGVDISHYKNVKVPTSYMAAHSDFDFIGNYDESLDAGLLHVADHHIAPGKKQWTWGNGDFGRMWDRNLTEEDGPYIELMTGVYTDNQPDFTWLKPQEEKTFVQYFMPYKGVGRVGNATKDAAVSLTRQGREKMELRVYVTGVYPEAEIVIHRQGEEWIRRVENLNPEGCFCLSFAAPGADTDYHVNVICDGKTLVSYTLFVQKEEPVPKPAQPLPKPEEIDSLEELYLAAQHLEQYRHATREPADYYLEGLRRDATDIRLNNGYGLLLLRRGQIRESIPYFEAAIKKQTRRNPNPYMGEAYFNLGLALDADGQSDAAYDAFYKAAWSAETQSAAFYRLACLEARSSNFEVALDFAEKSMLRNWHSDKARTMKAAMLRRLGRTSKRFLEESLEIDPLNMGCQYEKMLLQPYSESDSTVTIMVQFLKSSGKAGASDAQLAESGKGTGATDKQNSENDIRAAWVSLMREQAHNYLTLSLDYIQVGLYEDALDILQTSPEQNPLCLYYQGFVLSRMGRKRSAAECYERAEAMRPDCIFPNRVEEIAILNSAVSALGTAPMAHYYLGNLLYDKKQYAAAVEHWETAVAEKQDLAVAHRNLSIAYYNKENNTEKALRAMEKACELDVGYPRLWLEYDQLLARANRPVGERLAVMEMHREQVVQRDDLFLRWATLLNCEGEYETALERLSFRQFHPWEGGEGKVSSQYRYALIQLAADDIDHSRYREALERLEASMQYPANLGEGKLPNVPDNQAHYYMGLAYHKLGDEEKSAEYLARAAAGPPEPEPVLYYNDQPSDYIFYQGLAKRALGREAEAQEAFSRLVTYGEKHLMDEVEYDFFAVSLPEIEVYQEDIALRNRLYCNYLRALGEFGLGNREKAEKLLCRILEEQADYQGAIAHLKVFRWGREREQFW
ncbi:MAG: DUF5107 domain-containing protein [Lachnospiraceae bacterium]|nr:DUF5107 domain-containing protein [Lachnospiraceae bacterium]